MTSDPSRRVSPVPKVGQRRGSAEFQAMGRRGKASAECRGAKFIAGFTMVELLAVVLLISLLASLLLPAVQSAREGARRTKCASTFAQIGLAVRGYHAAFDQLPTQLSGTDGSLVLGQDNDRRLSVFVALLPFLDGASLWNKIQQPMTGLASDEIGMASFGAEESSEESGMGEQQTWVAGGPEPFHRYYRPWNSERPMLRCPSDYGLGRPAMGRTNYAVCLGDGIVAGSTGPMKESQGGFILDAQLAAQTEASMRGIFVPRVVMRFSDVTDGLSQTIMMGEIATDLGDQDIRTTPAVASGGEMLRDLPCWPRENGWLDPERPQFWDNSKISSAVAGDQSARRGYRWADGMPLYTAVNTILPPNRELTLSADRDDASGVVPPSSRHHGGAHVCFGDGAVRFLIDSIDAGDEHQPTVYIGSSNPAGSKSPYGLWGAMGTRAAAELAGYKAILDDVQ